MGLFIVFEGCDGTGKTTQKQLLIQKLKNKNIDVLELVFPDRTTPVGNLINNYLKGSDKLSPQMQHLLFVANRWEFMNKIKEHLENDGIVICDRYCYSGAAYSMTRGLTKEWCLNTEDGLIIPDIVIQLDGNPKELQLRLNKRDGDSKEIYDSLNSQLQIRENYNQIREYINITWHVVNALDDEHKISNTIWDLIN
jgi:dTMP kinase